MNNDLISREALKEATKNFTDCDGFNPVWQIIDNAPTVIATEDCISREGAINALSHDRVCCNVCRKALETILPVELTERPQGEPVIKCQDCKHQVKVWREDKRMGGYWVYDCDFISDPFESTPVCGQPEEYCSSAEQKGGAE